MFTTVIQNAVGELISLIVVRVWGESSIVINICYENIKAFALLQVISWFREFVENSKKKTQTHSFETNIEEMMKFAIVSATIVSYFCVIFINFNSFQWFRKKKTIVSGHSCHVRVGHVCLRQSSGWWRIW